MAFGGVKDIVLCISRIAYRPARFVKPERCFHVPNDVPVLIGTYGECLAKAVRSRIDAVIDMQHGFARSDRSSHNVPAAHVSPGLGISVNALMAPTDHGMRAIKLRILQMVRHDIIAQIFARSLHRDNKADMHAIGFDENLDAIFGFLPSAVRRNQAAQKRSEEIDTDDQCRPAEQSAQQRPRPVQPKKFHMQLFSFTIRYASLSAMDDALHVYDKPPEGANADWTIPQDWDRFSADEHAMWDRLFARQAEMLPGRAADAFLKGLDVLRLEKPGIPDYAELNARLMEATGWQVVAVPGLVPDDVFFDHLANRRFPAGNFIRKPEQLDYLQEPDIFHDVFGHVPMLADPVFGDYMQAYGEGGLRSLGFGALHKLARLYWYTVEFGLIREPQGLRIYGAGIVSSYGESIFAVEDESPNRILFDLERVMRTEYRIDDFQQNYFVIDSLDELLKVTVETDFAPLYARLEELPDIAIAAVIDGDEVLTRGTQKYARDKGWQP